jgi:hypothetical protein
MEVTIRLMLVIVISVIVVLIAITIIYSLGGDAVKGITGLFDWIMSLMGPVSRN